MATKFHYAWREEPHARSFLSGVSLHSHTWRSRESLGFFPGVVKRTYLIPSFIRWAEGRFQRKWNTPFDYRHGYWTSPVSPEKAYHLEADQIKKYGFQPLVSLTDHDSIEAPHELAADMKEMPISFEWTLPYKKAVFHIGVHNLPPRDSAELIKLLHAITAHPDPEAAQTALKQLNALPGVLTILNHPLSDQGQIGAEMHEPIVRNFLIENRRFIHALEINALQPWRMNRRVARIAEHAVLPLIAGGDRHGFEPNGAVNLTNAKTFTAFAEEVRKEKNTSILFMPQTQEPLAIRYAENVDAIMGDYPDLPGKAHWHDRVFYECPDGVTRSFTELIGDRFYALNTTTTCVNALGFVASNVVKPLWPSFERAM